MNNESDNEVTMLRKAPGDSVKVVGVHQSLDGSMAGQFAALKELTTLWARRIQQGWLNRRLAWYGTRRIIGPSLVYPLPACSLTEAQGNQIMGPLYRTLLPQLGMNRNFPRLWRHAPLCFAGCNLPHSYFDQVATYPKTLLTLGASLSLAGSNLRAALEDAQLELGSAECFFELDFDTWGTLMTPNTLVGAMWKAFSTHGIYVRFEQKLQPDLQRSNDQSIMDLCTSRLELPADIRTAINRCRIATHTLFLSDLVHGDGKTLIAQYYQATTATSPPRPSSFIFPNAKPTTNDWRHLQDYMGYNTSFKRYHQCLMRVSRVHTLLL
jgi:hypothetical protein